MRSRQIVAFGKIPDCRVLERFKTGEAELHVHDVLNVFMCTGFARDTHRYFMKASPVRPGDFLEFFAEIDLLCALSACPGLASMVWRPRVFCGSSPPAG